MDPFGAAITHLRVRSDRKARQAQLNTLQQRRPIPVHRRTGHGSWERGELRVRTRGIEV